MFMFACTCGYESQTEGDLMSHVLECHCLPYGLEQCCPLVTSDSECRGERNIPLTLQDSRRPGYRYHKFR